MKNFVEWYGVAKWKVEAVLNHEAKELRKARLTDEENRSVSLAAGDTKVERELEQVIPDNMRTMPANISARVIRLGSRSPDGLRL
jgi:hypothetical protein